MPPLPKPPEQRRRRNAAPSYDVLPLEGPKRRSPDWPLGEPNVAEVALWRDLWSRPVAVAWHSQRIPPVVVARYVRMLVEQPFHASLSGLEAALGLTPAALARLHLRVEPSEPEPLPLVHDNIAAIARRRARRER